MTTLKITWQAFGPSHSAEIEIDSMVSPVALCEMVFRDTNLYAGGLWDLIEPVLPVGRSHTALSVGDLVAVDGVTFRCDDAGWTQI